MDRVYWLNSGDSISVGDRKLTAVRPPLFDNPTTIGIYDNKSETFFSADCFGALIPSPAQDAEDVREGDLAQGMITWAGADSPWVHTVPPKEFSPALDKIRQMAPKMILSAHLPPAQEKTGKFLELLARVPSSTPFCCSQPDGTGADIGSEEGQELTIREPRKLWDMLEGLPI
jgi:flavorubredoxin